MIGVLALQGAFQSHCDILNSIHADCKLVTRSSDFNSIKGLIIPGGESTAISILLDKHKIRSSLIKFAKNNSVFGTCAGMILLSSSYESKNLATLNIMDFDVDRNYWGRQIDSFLVDVKVQGFSKDFKAYFIRAPKVSRVGTKVECIAYLDESPILLRQGKHLASSFHPEISGDSRIHEYYTNLVYS